MTEHEALLKFRIAVSNPNDVDEEDFLSVLRMQAALDLGYEIDARSPTYRRKHHYMHVETVLDRMIHWYFNWEEWIGMVRCKADLLHLLATRPIACVWAGLLGAYHLATPDDDGR